MRHFALAVLILAVGAACTRASKQAAPQQQASTIRTIDSVDPRPVVIDPPPVLTDEAPPPKPKVMPWETPTPIVFTPEDEKLRASLPFAPAIAMDPIDGGKISIRATTPTFEYKGKIYYFSSEANRKLFIASPEQYTKSGVMRL